MKTTIRRTATALAIALGTVGGPALLLAPPSDAAVNSISVPNSATASEALSGLGFTATGGSSIGAAAYDALAALHGGSTAAYRASLSGLAVLVGTATGIPSEQFVAVWSQADYTRMTAMLAALSQVGAGYRYSTAKPGGSFDCSGLTSWAWAQAGVSLPHQSRAIIRSIAPAALSGVLPGDVLYFPGHVMVSLGVADAYVHAADQRRGVEVTTLGRHRSVSVGDPLA